MAKDSSSLVYLTIYSSLSSQHVDSKQSTPDPNVSVNRTRLLGPAVVVTKYFFLFCAACNALVAA